MKANQMLKAAPSRGAVERQHLIRRWHLPALWLAPWVVYISSAALTVSVSRLNGSGWIHQLTEGQVVRLLAAAVVLFWLSARITVAVRIQSLLLVVAIVAMELPFAFLVFVVWAVGMIGGPINPG